MKDACRKTNTVLGHKTKLQERLTDDIVRNTCHVCDFQIRKQYYY